MSRMLKIGWIGGGKMAQALAKGIVSTGCNMMIFPSTRGIITFHYPSSHNNNTLSTTVEHSQLTFLLIRIDEK